MYSFEIHELMTKRNYILTPEDYFEILENTPQIARVSYDAFSNKYHIWTDDGCDWEFEIRKD